MRYGFIETFPMYSYIDSKMAINISDLLANEYNGNNQQ